MKVKRFLVFACNTYYPCGGWDDFIGSFDTKEQALEFLEATRWDSDQIIDLETGEEVR